MSELQLMVGAWARTVTLDKEHDDYDGALIVETIELNLKAHPKALDLKWLLLMLSQTDQPNAYLDYFDMDRAKEELDAGGLYELTFWCLVWAMYYMIDP